jgi:hypothetical protein
MPVQIQIRNGTAAQWTSANPVLAAGEVGIETDTRKQKFGDGTTAWNSLAYAGGTGTVTGVTGTSPVVSSGGAAPAISLASGYGDTLNPYASKTANQVLAAPNGTSGVPSFRALVSADIPTLNQNTTGTAAGLSATLAIGSGGTGLTSTPANGALDIGNGTGFTRTTLTAGSNVTITNGAGSITIAAAGGGGSPGGAPTNIQFNSSGSFGGSANLTWDGTNVQLGGAGALRFADSDNSNYASFQSPATLAANTAYTLPTALPTANNSTLVATTAGVMSWAAPAALPTVTEVDYLVVAGGGGGGSQFYAGGGGAGGFRSGTALPVTAGSPYAITVGAPGAGGAPPTDGGVSIFSSITSTGGGAGGYSASPAGKNGGSGGGCSNDNTTTPGLGVAGQGNNGGVGFTTVAGGGGGGGGAGGVGVSATVSSPGNGGAGSQWPSGSGTFYAGGGGGGRNDASAAGGTGGSSIGGNGGSATVDSTAGATNTGSGGGGASNYNGGQTGKNGGSGVVIIRYPDTFALATSATVSPTTSGGYRYYTFTGNGSITF